jgi:hypothetical protein
MDEEVKGKVNGPGIALMVVGILSLVTNLLNGIYQVILLLGQTAMMEMSPEGILMLLTQGGWSIIQAAIGFCTAFAVIYAGTCLRATKSSGMVYAGSILAMIPCCIGCCCIVGLPAGIWALVVMQDEKVKQAFEEAYY